MERLRPGFRRFLRNVLEDIRTWKDVKGVKSKPGRPDNFAAISSLPWLSFTGHGCDTFSDSRMILPIILFGKYFQQSGRTLLPFSVSVNHASADGYHSAKFLNDVQKFCDDFR